MEEVECSGTMRGTTVSWGRVAIQGVVAGLVGAALIDGYLWATTLLPQHAGIASLWRWIASAVLGKSAFGNPSAAAIGALVHGLVSIGWAAGYAYIAATRPATTHRWLVAGIVYGLIVYVIMQAILLADNNFTFPPNPNAFVNAVLAHTIFFGLPVALVVHVMRSRQPA